MSTLPDEAWLTALASLPSMGPSRLLAVSLLYEPADAWQAVCEGKVQRRAGMAERMAPDPAGLARQWQAAARSADVEDLWRQHGSCVVAARGSAVYPGPLSDDLEPPAVVFMRGEPTAVSGPRVAVVGTRRCTRYGFELARELGRDLALAGVRVVSGLALGVDGAAHRGALDAGTGAAPPLGIVASGLDVVYPKRHSSLWEEVVSAGGLLLSEAPLGTKPEASRFPARNRIIAAMADLVVVVESAGNGGSMYTVTQAMRRDRPVMAVPGSVRSAASAGTNKIIFDGGQMARDAADVLGLLGLSHRPKVTAGARSTPTAEGRRVLEALGWEAATLDSLALRTGLDLGALSVALADLESAGWVRSHGLWFEQVSGS